MNRDDRAADTADLAAALAAVTAAGGHLISLGQVITTTIAAVDGARVARGQVLVPASLVRRCADLLAGGHEYEAGLLDGCIGRANMRGGRVS